ncbi:hypothetical protein BDP27DRAFT_1441204 [Rhodocollybia butyracea]|uniref:Fungal-type protein kinase domain-containing protein n=1 Tax=Rhodocollybia butyracea TaxID=206335 RepID=A0A9P5QB44_9AGAR|nr:hypothetical protein BDP27DRAFT_1441204 [Rhodocollybia butyracea]
MPPAHVTASGGDLAIEPPRPKTNPPNTPARGKETSSSAFRSSSNVKAKRDSVIKTLPTMIPEVSVADFCTHILPPLPEALKRRKLGQVLTTLKHDQKWKDRGWSAFPQEPAARSEHETIVFRPMADIFRDVVNAGIKHGGSALEQTFNIAMQPYAAQDSDLGPGSRPDIIFERLSLKSTHAGNTKGKGKARQSAMPEERDAANSYLVYHHTVPLQAKKVNTPGTADDDTVKLVYDMSTILRLDPCRRFTFGITVENCDMRIWLLSRAALVKSKPFNFMKEPEVLIHLLLSFAFASPSKMGWDPTINFSHVDEGRRQYTIEVEGKVYTTISIILDSSADSPFGRGTRIWKVKDREGKIRVLKDLWLEWDRVPEHEILQRIIDDIKNLDDPEAHDMAEIVRERTLTPLAFCKVAVDDAVDDTKNVMMGGFDLAGQTVIDLVTAPTPASGSRQSVGPSLPSDRDHASQSLTSESTTLPTSTRSHLPPRQALAREQPVYSRRYHYRIVFEQYATTIYNERNLGNIINGLADVVLALQCIHQAGWVHRDISGGNLYWCPEQDTGLLGDFEYSRKVTDETTHHQVRTGTPFFMASEALCHGVLRRHDLQDDRAAATAVPTERPVFAYNALHDLESVWWILTWVLFFNEDVAHAAANRQNRQARMDQLFSGDMETTQRLPFFKDDAQLQAVAEFMSPTFAPAFTILVNFSGHLNTAYQLAESNYPHIEPLAFQDIHHSCAQALQSKALLADLSNITLIPVKALPQDTARGKKRSSTSLESQPKAKKSKTKSNLRHETKRS